MSRKSSIDPLIGASHSKVFTRQEKNSHEKISAFDHFSRLQRENYLRESINTDLFSFFCFIQESSSLLVLQSFSLYFFKKITLIFLGIASFSFFLSQLLLIQNISIIQQRTRTQSGDKPLVLIHIRFKLINIIKALGITAVSVINLALVGVTSYYFNELNLNLHSLSLQTLSRFSEIFLGIMLVMVFLAIRSSLGSLVLLQHMINQIFSSETEYVLIKIENKIRSALSFLSYLFFLSSYTYFMSLNPLYANLLTLILSYSLTYMDNIFLTRALSK